MFVCVIGCLMFMMRFVSLCLGCVFALWLLFCWLGFVYRRCVRCFTILLGAMLVTTLLLFGWLS